MRNLNKYKSAKVCGQRFDIVNMKEEDFRKMRRKRRIRAHEIQSQMIISDIRKRLKASLEVKPTPKLRTTGLISSLTISPGERILVDMGVAFMK